MLYDDDLSADVLFAHLLGILGFLKSYLKSMTLPTFKVGLVELPILGWIELPLMLKDTLVISGEKLFASIMTRFIVIDVALSYNSILYRKTQGNFHL